MLKVHVYTTVCLTWTYTIVIRNKDINNTMTAFCI